MIKVAEDIAVAETPPGRAYCDPALFRSEVEQIFTTAWLGLAPFELGKGFLQPIDLLPGALDESLLISVDETGTPRALSNVCTHRGMKLMCKATTAKRIRCGYHARRFALDGTLEAAPGFDGAGNFPRPEDDLSRVGLASWGPVPFLQLKSGRSFDDWIAPLAPLLDFLPLECLTHDASGSRLFPVHANWKLYLDNYLEGFHIPTVHKSLASALNVGAYRTELLPHGSLQIGIASKGQPVLPLGPSHPLAGEDVGALYVHLFPNTLFNVYPWGVSMNFINPVSPTLTHVLFERFVWKPELLDQGAGADLDRVEQEDEEVVEATQKGLRSRLYRRGRYAPKHEAAVHHFHRWWSVQMD